MALPSYTETRYRIWHYIYLAICTAIFIYLIAPLFVIFPLSFSHDEFLVFSEEMKRLDPDGFSTRWYKDMVWGTKNPWGLAAKNNISSERHRFSRSPHFIFSKWGDADRAEGRKGIV